jgi:hypothetical protein
MTRYALAIAHPSHELRVYGWLERERPVVYVLTDGGGRSQESRLPKTAELLARTGAQAGAIFGRLSDLALYQIILSRDLVTLGALAEELAADLIAREIDVIAGDAAEGYSSAHDVWRLIIDSAVDLVRSSGRTIENLEFFVVAPPDEVAAVAATPQRVTLDDGELARKLDAARAYSPTLAADVDVARAGGKFYGIRRFADPEPAGGLAVQQTAELAGRFLHDDSGAEASTLLRGVDADAFRHELFWRRDPAAPSHAGAKPFYEIYGEELVRAGRYQQVIRYEEHMEPIAASLGAMTRR